MRFSEIIESVKIQLNNATAKKWTDTTVGRLVNEQQRSLVRRMVELDEDYVNTRFVLPATAARLPNPSECSWRLPPWVMKVSGVRPFVEGSGRGRPIDRVGKDSRRPGWRHTASNELTLQRINQAIDLELDVAKLPARMTKGTLPDQTGVLGNQIRLDADASVEPARYPHEVGASFYAGGLFEITGPSSARVGQLLRSTSSVFDVAGSLLTMEEAWATPPLTADTYDMHSEIPEQHMRLLILAATRTLLAQENNAPGFSIIREEYASEYASFVAHVEGRDIAQPHYVHSVEYEHHDASYEDCYQEF